MPLRTLIDKKSLEIQLEVTAFAAAYLYLWTFENLLGLHLRFVRFDIFLKTPLISLVAFPLVFYGYVKADPLQRSHFSWRSVSFFQAEFPSLYIRERCQRCNMKARCRNFISPTSTDHTTYWLRDLWRPHFGNQHPDEFRNTFRRGYTCKLIFGTELLALTFLALGAITVTSAEITQLIWAYTSNHVFHSPVQVEQMVFLVGCFLIWLALSRLNIPDVVNPTGCWQAWREINRGHVLWLKENDGLLVEVICHAGGNNESFQQL